MKKRSVVALMLVGLAGAAAAWHFNDAPDQAHAANPPAQPPAVPVTAALAKVEDVPVYLRGLGTVQAFNTVEIRAQVNGTLIAVPVQEGQEVKQGEVIAEIDPRPFKAALDQATAQRAEDEAQLQSARLDLQRFQQLASRQFAPVQQVDDQRATVNKLAAAVQADSAAIETAQINLGFCTIAAPFNGRVSLRQTDPGNLIEVASQTGIVSITQDQPISVVFTLPEADLPRIQDAMEKGSLPVLADTSDDTTVLGRGTLLTPNNTIATSTGTIELKATFQNENHRLWPGEFVNVLLLVDTLHNAVTVPLVAVQHGPDGLFVYTIGPDGTAKLQPVATGYSDGAIAVVEKGLEGGETVVESGQSRLAPGTKVAMNGAGSPSPTSSSALTPSPAGSGTAPSND